MKKKLLVAIIISFLIVSSFSFFYSQKSAHAAKEDFKWEVDYPFEGPRSEQIPDYVEYIYRIAFFAGAALAVLMIIIGGIQWSTAGVNPSAKNEAKDKLTKSIMGVLLLIGSYALLRTINPDLVVLQEPVTMPDIKAELGADVVKTVQAPELCEANSKNAQENKDITQIPEGERPLCGDYCFYYCTGKYDANTKNFPTDYFKQKRSTLGLEDDFGYMAGHDPGSGTDVVWCGCYSLSESAEEVKRAWIEELLDEYKKQQLSELPSEADAKKKKIENAFEFTHLGTYPTGQSCEFWGDDNPKCGDYCFDYCRQKKQSEYGDTVFGVIASSNAGGGTDSTWCSCFKGPEGTNEKIEGFDFHFNEAPYRETFKPAGQPCESAGEGYPRCGNYCYQFCKEKNFKFGVTSGGNYGSGTDEAFCTCFK